MFIFIFKIQMEDIKVVQERVRLTNGTLWIPTPIEKPSDALAILQFTMVKHTTDMFRVLIKIICEKHGLNEEELLEEVVANENFKNFLINPVITDLGNYIRNDEPAKEEKIQTEPEQPAKKYYLDKSKIKIVTKLKR